MAKATICNSLFKPGFTALRSRIHIEQNDYVKLLSRLLPPGSRCLSIKALDDQRHTQYYESSKVLGMLYQTGFREIQIMEIIFVQAD